MDETRAIVVSPRHSVLLASELYQSIERPPRQDFVVRTLAHREANGLPLMSADIVIASAETRKTFAAAQTYPLHFRKTYFPGRLHGDPAVEFEHHLLASGLCATPPPIGHTATEFRACLIPGQPFSRLTPFGGDPPDNNIAKAQKLSLPTAAGLWRIAEDIYAQLLALHAGGMVHGDAELHNCIVCPSPLEAIFLQCALGRQPSALGEAAWAATSELFKSADRFRIAIETQAGV